MSLDKKYIGSLRKDSLAYAEKRRALIKDADDALHLSKRAIFAMHRGDMKQAKEKLGNAEKLLKQLAKKNGKDVRLMNEGAFKAGTEEYVEATLLYSFLTNGSIGKMKAMDVKPEVYLAGLCDVPGELLRHAIAAATEGNMAQVQKNAQMAQEIVGELIEFNLTKHLRHKFDQAKSAVQKLERVVYDLSLRDV